MKMMIRLLALMAAMMVCLTPVLGAMAEAAEPAAEAAAEENNLPFTGAADDVLITVNGQAITRAVVENLYASIYETYSYYGAYYGIDVTDPATREGMYAAALYYSTRYAVEDQAAEKLGFTQFTDEELAALATEVDATWESYIESYITYYGGGLAENATDGEKAAARENAIAGLSDMGYSYDELMASAKNNAAYEKLQADAVKDVVVDDAAIQAAFDAKVAEDTAAYAGNILNYELSTQYYGQESYYVPEGYRGVTHILLNVDEELLSAYQDLSARLEEQEQADGAEATEGTEEAAAEPTEPVTQEQVDAAREAVIASVQDKIDAIYARLDAGESFESLIAEFGNDPGMESEPYASEGYSVAADSVLYDPVFVQAAFSVDNVGDVAQPVVGMYGVHIVKYLRDVPSGAVPMTDAIKDSLRSTMTAELESAAYSAALNSWMDASDIVFENSMSQLMAQNGYIGEDGKLVAE